MKSKYITKAVALAATSRCRYQHGAVIVYRGQIIASGVNKIVNDQTKGWRRSHVHAEVAALLEAGPRAAGATMYVARLSADGTPVNSEPCKKCKRYLEKYKVGNVFWT
jgi:pyrimidine deaminase RibD-like protein